jgi:hypothetical protein
MPTLGPTQPHPAGFRDEYAGSGMQGALLPLHPCLWHRYIFFFLHFQNSFLNSRYLPSPPAHVTLFPSCTMFILISLVSLLLILSALFSCYFLLIPTLPHATGILTECFHGFVSPSKATRLWHQSYARIASFKFLTIPLFDKGLSELLTMS